MRLIAHAIENSLAYRIANFRMKKSKIERTSKPATAAQQRISKRVHWYDYRGIWGVLCSGGGGGVDVTIAQGIKMMRSSSKNRKVFCITI